MEGKGGLNIADFAGMIDGAIKRIINHLGDIPFIGVPSNPVDFDLMEENIHIIETATTGMRVVIRGMKLSQGLSSPGEEGPTNNLEEIIGKARVKGERLRRRQKQEKELTRRQGKATSKKGAG